MEIYSCDELHDLEMKYKFYVNGSLEPVFYSRYDARKFIIDVLKVRAPQFEYRCKCVCDDEGFEVYVIYVAAPYKIFIKE